MNTVSVPWLKENLSLKNLIIFDASIAKVTHQQLKKKPDKKQIKKARFFDIKKEFSNSNNPFPNTLLSPNKFEEKAQKIGVNQHSIIVVYDDLGIYSSARVWWMFKAMGHKNIAVLDGGFPKWLEANYPIEDSSKLKNQKIKKGNFKVNFNASFFCKKQEILKAITNQHQQIIDARSNGRFLGLTPEPRKDVRNGHIPTAVSLPYSELLDDGKLKSIKEIKQKFNSLEAENKQLIFSCGSGVTACVLALAATIVGYTNLSVYDGSWTEWGSLFELPIEK